MDREEKHAALIRTVRLQQETDDTHNLKLPPKQTLGGSRSQNIHQLWSVIPFGRVTVSSDSGGTSGPTADRSPFI